MNKLLSKRLIGFQLKPLVLMCRSVTYEVLPTGEKIVVNTKPNVSVKKEKWQKIRPMGYEPELRDIKRIEFNERLESNPQIARNTASDKLRSLKDSLINRGFCRETKPYIPPKNVENIIEDICRKVLSNESKAQKWSEISIKDRFIKYKFLTECSKQLNYEIPNSLLYSIQYVSDVLTFYSTPIRGIISYNEMSQNRDQMPPNLHVIEEPLLYNQETDTHFGGISAYPFSTYRIKGLRAKKKYPNFKEHFIWPDV